MSMRVSEQCDDPDQNRHGYCDGLTYDGLHCDCAYCKHPNCDPSRMSYPVRCTRCGNIHDSATVTVVQRYSDCSTWRCPGCHSLIDDRPLSWGGSAEPVTADIQRRWLFL